MPAARALPGRNRLLQAGLRLEIEADGLHMPDRLLRFIFVEGIRPQQPAFDPDGHGFPHIADALASVQAYRGRAQLVLLRGARRIAGSLAQMFRFERLQASEPGEQQMLLVLLVVVPGDSPRSPIC